MVYIGTWSLVRLIFGSCFSLFSTSWKTCLGLRSLGSILLGARYPWHTTKISADSILEAWGLVESTFLNSCWSTHIRGWYSLERKTWKRRKGDSPCSSSSVSTTSFPLLSFTFPPLFHLPFPHLFSLFFFNLSSLPSLPHSLTHSPPLLLQYLCDEPSSFHRNSQASLSALSVSSAWEKASWIQADPTFGEPSFNTQSAFHIFNCLWSCYNNNRGSKADYHEGTHRLTNFCGSGFDSTVLSGMGAPNSRHEACILLQLANKFNLALFPGSPRLARPGEPGNEAKINPPLGKDTDVQLLHSYNEFAEVCE